MSYIPKIIHQIWIGPKKAPINHMNTWKEKHPEFEYMYWNEEKIITENILDDTLKQKINEMEEINGKADILRWEILYKYGGVFIDADSICIEPIDTLLDLNKSFASYENEQVRGVNWCNNNRTYDDVLGRSHALIATGTMAFPKFHMLPKMAIEWIKNNKISVRETNKRAWRTVGPGLLTRLYYLNKWDDILILPSYYFLPIHCSGLEYKGHGKVYAYQEWSSTKNNYDKLNDVILPDTLMYPKKEESVSVLISSYNTKLMYISECLESIKEQIGHFNIEIVWINDGSDEFHTTLLERKLEQFIKETRFISLVYHKNEKNMGVSYSLHTGLLLCNNEIIVKMDSDDIMFQDRIYKQFEFMKKNKNIHVCGGQILMFRDKKENIVSRTNHNSLTFEEYKKRPLHWIMNHPTICYRKESVIDVGNYNKEFRIAEDFELELRMLSTYKYIHNFNEPLLYYRLHNDQLTYQMHRESEYWNNIRIQLINNTINK